MSTGDRGSYGYPTVSHDKAGLETFSYGYELDHHNSSTSVDENEQSSSYSRDSGPIVLQHPEEQKVAQAPEKQTYLPGGYPYLTSKQASRNNSVSHYSGGSRSNSFSQRNDAPRSRTSGSNSSQTDGRIFVENDIHVSVTRASSEHVDRQQPADGKPYYSYSGSGLRNGMGRQYSFSAPRAVSRDRERGREFGDRQRTNQSPEPTYGSDLGRDYYLRGIA
jgi:hypothetical protein